MTNSPYLGAGWVFRPGAQKGFREIAMLSDAIAFGFCDLGDLSALPPLRTAFRRRVSDAYAETSSSRYPILISQFYWFVAAMEAGDLVALVDERKGILCLGRISGPYSYRPANGTRCNIRPVVWMSAVPLLQLPKECRSHWRARTGVFPMGKIFPQIAAFEGDSLVGKDRGQAG